MSFNSAVNGARSVRIGAMRDLVKAAKQFANSSHQRITASRNPASQGIEVHLRSVAQIVSSVTPDEETIAAAWLHDLVEDTSVTLDDLEREFGRSVAETVSELSVVTRNRRHNPAARLEALKRHFATISSRAKTIKLADLLDTCRDLHRNDPGAFTTYFAEANALLPVLSEGASRLFERLKRDLEKYAGIASRNAPPSIEAEPGDNFVAITPLSLRIFAGGFSAQDIADPLRSFDFDRSPQGILHDMTKAGIQVAGLRVHGEVTGFIEAANLRHRAVMTEFRPFASGQVIRSTSSLMEVVEVPTLHDRCFVTTLGIPVGVISRIDIEKPAGRMWLFGIITVAELEFTERLRQRFKDDTWMNLLTAQRVEKARELYAERMRRNQKCQLIDCLQFSDKMEILASDPLELTAFDIPTASAARRAIKQIEGLRNCLAHSQGFVEQDWPQVVRLARRIHHIVMEAQA
jgi:hypothetical protein